MQREEKNGIQVILNLSVTIIAVDYVNINRKLYVLIQCSGISQTCDGGDAEYLYLPNALPVDN